MNIGAATIVETIPILIIEEIDSLIEVKVIYKESY
jgi:hypothetical protein